MALFGVLNLVRWSWSQGGERSTTAQPPLSGAPSGAAAGPGIPGATASHPVETSAVAEVRVGASAAAPGGESASGIRPVAARTAAGLDVSVVALAIGREGAGVSGGGSTWSGAAEAVLSAAISGAGLHAAPLGAAPRVTPASLGAHLAQVQAWAGRLGAGTAVVGSLLLESNAGGGAEQGFSSMACTVVLVAVDVGTGRELARVQEQSVGAGTSPATAATNAISRATEAAAKRLLPAVTRDR